MTGEREAWSRYWAQGGGVGCLPGAPVEVGEMLGRIWAVWAEILPERGEVLDIAAGRGAVMRALHDGNGSLRTLGVDYAVTGHGPGIIGGVDAATLPFDGGRFAGVASQFGIEYCGPAALDEAARVLAPGGALQFVCHHAASVAVRHNRGRLAAMQAMTAAGLFELARDVAAGQDADEARDNAIGEARQAHPDQSICTELPMALGQALRRRGAGAAVEELAAKAHDEMLRLTAMVAAASDAGAIAAMCARLQSAGAEVEAAPLPTPDGLPLAWLVTGRRIA